MESTSRDDIRSILKSFGMKADEVIIAYLARNPGDQALQVKLTLEDVTDYAGAPPAETLRLEMTGEIKR
jgi:hypothetical protein